MPKKSPHRVNSPQGKAADVPRNERNRPYDVCLSFAGEDRSFVEKVATTLKRLGVAVFYDRHEQSNLWGKDLYAHLDVVYRLSAKFCIVFISKNYAKKLWTNHERRSAQARAFLENDEYILPVRMDETEIPGMLPTVGFIDANRASAQQIAKMVVEKLAASNQDARVPLLVNSEFQRIMYEGFDFAGFSPIQIREAIEGRWLTGRRASWHGKMVDGKYVLTNRTKFAATLNNQLTFRANDDQLVNLGDGKVSVRVRVLPPYSTNTGGGLMFRGSAREMTYLTFYRKPGNAFSLCKVIEGKLEQIWTDEILEIDDKEFCRLSMSGNRKRVELFVDSALVYSFTNDWIIGPVVGTSAIGTGVFEFDDFSMYSRRSR